MSDRKTKLLTRKDALQNNIRWLQAEIQRTIGEMNKVEGGLELLAQIEAEGKPDGSEAQEAT